MASSTASPEGLTDEDPGDLSMYGYDAQGPSCLEGDNNVVVEPIEFDFKDAVEAYILDNVDPLRESNELGVDIYCEVLRMVTYKSVIYTKVHI